jgi:hypothetical protein
MLGPPTKFASSIYIFPSGKKFKKKKKKEKKLNSFEAKNRRKKIFHCPFICPNMAETNHTII